MRVRAREGCTSVGIGGIEIKLDETGCVDVPVHIAKDLCDHHGFTPAGVIEITTKAPEPKAEAAPEADADPKKAGKAAK